MPLLTEPIATTPSPLEKNPIGSGFDRAGVMPVVDALNQSVTLWQMLVGVAVAVVLTAGAVGGLAMYWLGKVRQVRVFSCLENHF